MNYPKIEHYIITRFNMPWVKDEKHKSKGLDSDYLRERFDIFDRYTVPSVKNQTCKNFKWLVIFDSRTPKEFIDKINSYRQLDFYEPLFVEVGFSLKDYIDELIEHSSGQFISSRLDNDDAILPNYVEEVQQKAAKIYPKDKYITSPINYRYDAKDKTLTTYRLKKNHFISRTGNVFEVNQNHMPSNPAEYVVIPGAYTVEVVHESNLLNDTIYTYTGMLNSKTYKGLKENLEYDLLPYADYETLCKKRARQDISKNIEKKIIRFIKIFRKHILKEKR